MIKRVAYFDYVIKDGDDIVALTPNKEYKVFDEKDDSFVIKDDEGTPQFCLKSVKDCAHLDYKTTWILLDTEETSKKPKKWSKWYRNKTGEKPVELKRKQKVKLKWSDGDKYVITNPHDGAWYIDKDGVNITHYKVKLKDVSSDTPKAQKKPKSKWTKNTGVCPVDGSVKVEFKRRDGQKSTLEAYRCTWRLSGEDYDIIKWRLVD